VKVKVKVKEKGNKSVKKETKNILNSKLLTKKQGLIHTIADIDTNVNANTNTNANTSVSKVQSCIQALKAAFKKIDTEVTRISHWSFQGSTAVAVLLCQIQEEDDGDIDNDIDINGDNNGGSISGSSSSTSINMSTTTAATTTTNDNDNIASQNIKHNQEKTTNIRKGKNDKLKRSNININNININNNNNTKKKKNNKKKTILISANVGDSRAVLSHSGKAVDLTRDHKPNDPKERQRIEKLGGKVVWCGPVHPKTGKPIRRIIGTSSGRGANANANRRARISQSESASNNSNTNKIGKNRGTGTTTHSLSARRRSFTGIYRINGNLALSRAIGDRSEKPLVSSEVDIQQIELDCKRDEFIILASDGLWVSSCTSSWYGIRTSIG
jgi:serine/threonine protein phosphatase PrpC